MAKVAVKKAASGPPQKQKAYGFPSRFGSHSSMLATEQGDINTPDEKYVACVDEYGRYITERSRLDTGLADPNRYAINRLGKLFEKTVKEDK